MINKLNELIIKSEIARHEEGQAMVEYGLIVGLISVVAVVALGAIGGTLSNTTGTGIFDLILKALKGA